jgi:hypothetical protein
MAKWTASVSMAVLLTGIGFAENHRTYAGTVEQIPVESGAAVRENLLADTSRERAQLEAALADHRQAVSIAARMEAMLQEGIVLRADYNRAKAESELAAVRVTEIRARIAAR